MVGWFLRWRVCPLRQQYFRRNVLSYLYSVWHQFWNSYFWPDWNSYVRLSVFHTIFNTKEVTCLCFPKKLRLKFLIIRFLTSVAYCNIARLVVLTAQHDVACCGECVYCAAAAVLPCCCAATHACWRIAGAVAGAVVIFYFAMLYRIIRTSR